ncbi:DUF2939 domain-containing protein [Noviherbaspirillum galbum]|uniref:DUF2939 domain-containing protein n=1 Tax=Noviherbaspirillum galbum TaxID=2709383 RepID=A0A6B3SRD7_9BURK|nr:DUF2939 domain-containing protein [Noviherbaspirillum galbum]NEX60219.1 DUF2939 domain-containing protein [Noviherbaspirillum galbum]
MNRKVVVGGMVIVAGLAAASYFSPYITLYQMRQAMQDKDGDRFSDFVDFPALRESFKGQMMAAMNTQTESMKDNPFAAFGAGLATMLVDKMVDSMISPAGVIAMMKTGSTNPVSARVETATENNAGTRSPDFTVRYHGWNRAVVHLDENKKDRAAFVLRREGLWSWKLAGVQMPDSLFSKK